ncbi:UNVERIFIED_CONTAM: Retrovirus-related Pol polyprotein from transposon TNT 1-94 [Sesamum calycinum]|uniref:Retrovirus-related Pol polyprotein from transposon TNT 1-94 n=1 Tax=Sesamum calycinum TaxID=2727403 RepID=A0AAW2J3B6_9LAMI
MPEPDVPIETSSVAITPITTEGIGTNANVKYDRDNKMVRGHLLSHMSNTLFDLFVNQKSAKKIWNTLETRYEGDDAGRKKYVANVLLEKFPPSWSEYRNHLKHKKKDLNLQKLISHMRTEEANRLKDKRTSNSSISFKANLVESSTSNKEKLQPKVKKFQKGRQQKSFKENDEKIQKNKEEVITVVVVEANLVENKADWILDMGNSTTAGVLGKGKIFLKLTSGKTLALIDVLYVPSLRRNLISGSLLNKAGLKIVLEADKLIITKNGDFVEKGSVMFLMNYTRPDIAYAVSRLSRYTHNQNNEHWSALHYLLRYLKGQEAEWLRNLVGDMPMWGSSIPVSIHCDSQAAIEWSGIAKNYAYNGKRRHIRIRHGAIKELLKNGIIFLEYVRSERNLADPLTK